MDVTPALQELTSSLGETLTLEDRMGMLVAKWNLFHKCALTFLALASSPLWSVVERLPFLLQSALCLRSPPLQCHLDQDPQLSLMLQKFITIFLFTDYCHSLLSGSLIYHLKSEDSSHHFRGENMKTHKDIVGCPRSQRTKEL